MPHRRTSNATAKFWKRWPFGSSAVGRGRLTLGRGRTAGRNGQRALRLEGLDARQLMAADWESAVCRLEDPADLAAVASTAKAQVEPVAGLSNVVGLPPQAGTEAADEVGFETFASEAELKQFLIDRAVKQYAETLGKTLDYHPFGWWWYPWTDVATVGPQRETNNSHSNTNTQVAGVDEADLMETDGNNLYLVRGQELLIFDTTDAAQPKLISRTMLDGWVDGIYLRKDRLTVVSRAYNWNGGPIATFGRGTADAMRPGIWWGGASTTIVSVLDVSKPEAAVTVKRFELDGDYVSSRSIDGKVVLVQQRGLETPQPLVETVDKDGNVVPDPWSDPKVQPQTGLVADISLRPIWWDNSKGYKFRVESEAAYRARLEGTILNTLPQYRDVLKTDANTVSKPLLDPTDIYKPVGDQIWNLNTVTVIDTTLAEPAIIDSVGKFNSYSNTLYVGAESLYTVEYSYSLDTQTQQWRSETLISKFSLKDGRPRLVATGKIDGNLLNQFSLDEYNGALRVAVTQWNTGRTVNALYVLLQEGTELNVVGKITDLAPTERIFSARFMGDKGYIVTFRQIDPLFTLDLSNPRDPKVVGELKLPGFSTYLQELQPGYVLGVGRDADPLTGRRGDSQLTLFNVNNLANPTVQSQVTLVNGMWNSSVAEYDHHAVGWYSSYNTLAIPVTRHQFFTFDSDGDGRPDADQPVRNVHALRVFRVTFDSLAPNAPQFVDLGSVEHDSQVLRSVQIADYLYSIAQDSLEVVPINNPGETITEIVFGQNVADVRVDPLNPGKNELVVLGTAGNDRIDVHTDSDGAIHVKVNGRDKQVIKGDQISSIRVDALAGADQISLSGGEGKRPLTLLNDGADRVIRSDIGDFNRDGKVDIVDFALLRSQWGSAGIGLRADADGDGSVGIQDFIALRRNFGKNAT